MKILPTLTLLTAALVCTVPASAATFTGHVVGITDGDTITVLDHAKRQHKVRLAGIDAPEKWQAFGQLSRQNLSALVFREDVELRCRKRDKYGRDVCVVYLDGHDVNLKQIQAGLAWWYRQYAREQSPSQRAAYKRAQMEAKAERRGLWRDGAPVPPWKWRRERKGW